MTRWFGPHSRRLAGPLASVAAVALGAAVTHARPWDQTGGVHSGPAPMETAIAQKQAIVNQWMTPLPGAATPPQGHPGDFVPCPALSAQDVPHAGEVRSRAQDGFPVPFSAMTYDITTLYQDMRNNMELQVWAGSFTDDGTQGVIIVSMSNQCIGQQGPGGEFLTPSKVGPVTLTRVVGNTVSFSYPSGAGTFDLSTHQFSLPSR
jgi:hypothetical protein